MIKWKEKVQSDNISLNQVSNCFKNLTSKFFQNDYLDYKGHSIHGSTQFNSNLTHYKPNVQTWCNHCLNMGIRASEDFAHAVYYCPLVQYILHEVQSILKLESWPITASNCILKGGSKMKYEILFFCSSYIIET